MNAGLPGFRCIGEPDCSSCSWNETDPLRAKFKNLVQFLPAAQQSPVRLDWLTYNLALTACMEALYIDMSQPGPQRWFCWDQAVLPN